jgi:hypothetical protein
LIKHLRSPAPPTANAVAAAAEVAEALLATAQRHASTDRVMVPWLRTLDILFNANCILPSLPADHTFPAAVLATAKAQLKGCRDVAKLMALVQLLCHLAGLRRAGGAAAAAADGALHALLLLLVNKYPKVRHLPLPKSTSHSAASGLWGQWGQSERWGHAGQPDELLDRVTCTTCSIALRVI